MQIQRKKLGRIYTPLNISVSLVCVTPQSPLMQVFDSMSNSYQPNRALSPTVVRPVITVSSQDGSVEQMSGNLLLADDIKWYVGDLPIGDVLSWRGQYAVQMAEGVTKGELTIMRNVSTLEHFSIRFEGTIGDRRTGKNYTIKSEPLLLMTTEKSDDKYQVEVGISPTHIYDPVCDKLLKYDYEVSNGLAPASTSAREACMDGNQYLQSYPITLRHGMRVVTEDVKAELYSIKRGVWTKVEEGGELQSITPQQVTLDLRVVDDGDSYGVKVFTPDKDGTMVERAKTQFTIMRGFSAYRVQTINDAEIMPSDITRRDKAVVSCRGRVVENPEYLYGLTWKVATRTNADGTVVGYGADVSYTLEGVGAGDDADSGWVDQWIETEDKGTHHFLDDGGGNRYVDEDGNYLITN